MKKIYFLFCLVFGFGTTAQIVNIPDANFKAKLLSASPSNQIASTNGIYYGSINWNPGGYISIDTNGDGEIQVSEAIVVKWLNISNSDIADLTGIEAFPNLQVLLCHNNSLTSINISNNLNVLVCRFNLLTNITLSSSIGLREFICNNNQLTSLDVSQFTNLRTLNCRNNQLYSLNLSYLSQLSNLYCDYNQLSSLNVQQIPLLLNFSCRSNLLNNLDVSLNNHLYYLDCGNNLLSSLNVTQNSNLNNLNCGSNQLVYIDVSQNLNLRVFNCSDNQLQNLNLLQNEELENLNCYVNQLENLFLSENQNLNHLNCSYNQLDILDLSNNPLLNLLSCANNELTYINIKNNGSHTWEDDNYGNSTLYFADNPNLEFICTDLNDIANVQNKIDIFGYTSTCNVNDYCSFTPGGTFYVVQGNIYFDIDNNGCDVTDPGFPNMRMNIANATSSSTNITGQMGSYYIPVGAGTHTITPNFFNPSYFNLSPSPIIVDFPTMASPHIQDICVTPNGQHSDVEVTILPIDVAQPGFDANYKIVYKNIGNQAENGDVTLAFQDDVLDYVTSTPVYDATGTNTLTWNFTNLVPFETREILVTFNVNGPTETPSVNIGDVLNYTAEIAIINIDEDLSNNISTLSQIVFGSYDPNDKVCIEGETITSSMVGEYVSYMIRFENTGTYPAQNIVVKDMIDETKFDISTLQPISGSHEFYTRINDNKVEFIFENINLDFNDPNNDGYVAFKIKTLPTLSLNDTFSNEANIYFDYNFPITTNNFTTTVQNALSSQDFEFTNEFTLYPNPVKDVLNIQSKNGMEIQSVEIYNVLGQVVIAVPNATQSIDVSSLETGSYFIKMNTERGSATSKFIKE